MRSSCGKNKSSDKGKAKASGSRSNVTRPTQPDNNAPLNEQPGYVPYMYQGPMQMGSPDIHPHASPFDPWFSPTQDYGFSQSQFSGLQTQYGGSQSQYFTNQGEEEEDEEDDDDQEQSEEVEEEEQDFVPETQQEVNAGLAKVLTKRKHKKKPAGQGRTKTHFNIGQAMKATN